jgi:hypothetical protein
MHNRWEWVIYNRRKRVPFFSPFFGFRSFFVLNILILSPIIYNWTHWVAAKISIKFKPCLFRLYLDRI